MKLKNYIFILIIHNTAIYTSHMPVFPSLFNPSTKNPVLQRVDTLAAHVEDSKAQADLLQAASSKSHNDTKIAMIVRTQQNKKRAEELAMQDEYNRVILECHYNLDTPLARDRNTLKEIGLSLYQVLDDKRSEDQPILDQLNSMYKNLENKYCFKKPSTRTRERARQALFEVVNARLLEINSQNQIEDDTSSSGYSTPVKGESAPVYAVTVDKQDSGYRRFI